MYNLGILLRDNFGITIHFFVMSTQGAFLSDSLAKFCPIDG